MIALHFLFPVARFIPLPWRFAGVLPIAAGIALNVAAARQFKPRNTTVKPFQESSAQNPMYLGMVLIVSGIAIIEGSVTPWIVVAALVLRVSRS